MTPTEYLLSIRALFSAKTESETEEFRQAFGITEKDFELRNEDLLEIATKVFSDSKTSAELGVLIAKFTKFEEKDFCHQLIEQYRSSIPMPYLELIDNPNIVDYGIVADDRPYCSITHVEHNTYAILMSQGLQRVLYSALRTFSAHILIETDEKRNAISFKELNSILSDDFFVFKHTFMIYPRQDVQISAEQIILANHICIYSQLFYLLHEFSHILITNAMEGNTVSIEEDELSVDYFAMISCLDMGNTVDEKELIFLACIFALLVFATLEKLSIYQVESDYPSFQKRIDNLKLELRKMCDSESTYERVVNSANIAESVFSQMNRMQDSEYEKLASERVNAQIESYLTASWNFTIDENYIVPDYQVFSNNMQHLLSGGHYEAIYESLLTLAKHALSSIDKILENNKNNINEVLSERQKEYFMLLNKLKLIYHFTHTLPDPIAQVFIGIYDLAKQETACSLTLDS